MRHPQQQKKQHKHRNIHKREQNKQTKQKHPQTKPITTQKKRKQKQRNIHKKGGNTLNRTKRRQQRITHHGQKQSTHGGTPQKKT